MTASPFRSAASRAAAVLVVACWFALLFAPSPAAAQDGLELPTVTRAVAITGAQIVQAPGRVIERGTVLIRDGVIEAVGTGVSIPYDARRIDGDSLVVYAGFIDGLSHAGLAEADGEQEEEVENPGDPSYDRAGIQPDRRVRSLLDPQHGSIESLRALGFTTAHVVPRGQLLPGTGAILQLAGEDPSAMILAGDVSLFARFEGAEGVYPTTPMAVIATFRQLYREAQRRQEVQLAYAEDPSGHERPPQDPVHAAFRSVIEDDRPVFFQTDDALEAHRALALSEELGFPLALAGLQQAFEMTQTLQEADVPLFLTLDLPEEEEEEAPADTLSTEAAPEETVTTAADTARSITPEAPSSFFVRDFRTRSYEDVEEEQRNLEARQALAREQYYATAATLHEAGLRFGFTTMDAKPEDIRQNLRLMTEHGLPEEAALAALTTDAAALLGLSGRLGTVEEGKIANLVVTTGPYFEEDSQVRYVFVDGRAFEHDPQEEETAPGEEADPAGTWSYTVSTPDGEVEGTLTVEGDPGSLSGTITSSETPAPTDLENVQLEGSTLSFRFDAGQFGQIEAELTISGDALEGTFEVPDLGTAPVTGTRTSGPER